jgi:hypothetical protein
MTRATLWRLAVWKLMRRFASYSVLAVNYPDLCDEHPDDWIVLQRGTWGTLAFTRVGGRVLLTVWKGYTQGSPGALLTRGDVLTMLRSFDT